jgi:hypothetical protein
MTAGHRALIHHLSKSDKAPVFSYIFDHGIDKFQEEIDKRISQIGNRTFNNLHTDYIPPWKDIYHLFERKREVVTNSNRVLLEDEGNRMSEYLVRLYVSFANYGSPKQGLLAVRRKLLGLNQRHSKWQRVVSAGKLNHFIISDQSEISQHSTDFRRAVS